MSFKNIKCLATKSLIWILAVNNCRQLNKTLNNEASQ